MIDNEELLNKYDSGAGDGDCGTTHARGARMLLDKLKKRDHSKKLGLIFSEIADTCSEDMGGSSGAMYSIFFTSAARTISKFQTVSLKKLAVAFKEGLTSVMQYGGAEIGDRTMTDVMHPVIFWLSDHANSDFDLNIMKDIAMKQCEATIHMKAKAGRASYVSSEHLKFPDPGAKAVELVIRAIQI